MSRLPAVRAAAGLALAALSTLHGSPATAQEPPPAPVVSPDAVAAPAPIRIVPPAEARGRVRIDAIATDPEVARVVFLVDGEEAGSDGRPPYRLRLELEPDSGPRTLRALAYDREGRHLGEHAITLGAAERPFEVAIRRLLVREAGIGADRARPGTSEELEVEVDVAVPPGGRLDRLEIYRNRELVARLREPPFRARFSTSEPHPEDYLRAVAHLADGRVREDARPIAAARGGSGHGDRVEVNLVEVFAVATGRAGGAVHGLTAEDFRVLLAGRELAIERFQEARQVPLTLGLMVDSSTSMHSIMEQTRTAAGRFLERILAPGDRAFLVDVDTRPRLAHPLTGDPTALTAAFGELEAEGGTALYDALTLALLELRRHAGRRALVALTDGQDSTSFLGLGRCLELARRSGVPVYVLSVGGLDERTTRPDRNLRLEAFARDTGGRLFPVMSA
ncbi:MAG TPA: VWA domain-containing protein, partial [Thermoanaerobaculia bacterium]|nr:VWA domain-containing protein [Thermoanaerobaculia bacterium]